MFYHTLLDAQLLRLSLLPGPGIRSVFRDNGLSSVIASTSQAAGRQIDPLLAANLADQERASVTTDAAW